MWGCDGACSLREAIQAVDSPGSANSDCAPATFGANTIVLGPHLYTLGAGAPSVELMLAPTVTNLTLTGAGEAKTVIDASRLFDRVLEIPAGPSVTISGLTITGGTAHFEPAFPSSPAPQAMAAPGAFRLAAAQAAQTGATAARAVKARLQPAALQRPGRRAGAARRELPTCRQAAGEPLDRNDGQRRVQDRALAGYTRLLASPSDTRTLIETAVKRFLDEVPALQPLKLVVGLELRARGDPQLYRVELPGPKVTKDIASDAKVRVSVPRSHFNELATKGRVRDWREAFTHGDANATGVEQVLRLIVNVVEKQEERARTRKARL